MKFLTIIFVVVAMLAIALNAVAQNKACVSALGQCESTKDCCANLVCWTSVGLCVDNGGGIDLPPLVNTTFP